MAEVRERNNLREEKRLAAIQKRVKAAEKKADEEVLEDRRRGLEWFTPPTKSGNNASKPSSNLNHPRSREARSGEV
ncbi:hypothetical protein PIIN_10305 [Serendipita indica DSM 11827]|uniref:Uncharacterized protein n=1 Tax=Serendipita indica (strain DSM 11827) TaxID=1109443 RepID=G4TYB7_SERID|nr:hypothetical protein PIIN_10305 [Serendipita indica DSM 11827]